MQVYIHGFGYSFKPDDQVKKEIKSEMDMIQGLIHSDPEVNEKIRKYCMDKPFNRWTDTLAEHSPYACVWARLKAELAEAIRIENPGEYLQK